MFSAIYNIGNIFYGRAEDQDQVTDNTDTTSNKFSEASTQTFDNKSASTQVNLDESKQSNHNESTKLNDTLNSQSGLDWVIVDGDTENPENEKACGADNSNDVEMKSDQDNNQDQLIGSFFQKHETDDTSKPIDIDQANTDNQQTQPILPKKNDTWLITPLPCLTSITESSQQKSMIDNDPLENLLIEQPTRFMSASVSEATTVTKKTTPKRRINKNKRAGLKNFGSVMQSDDDACFIRDLFKEDEPVEPVTPYIATRTVGEKRKEAEKSPVSPSSPNESPKKISRKSAKNLKVKGGAQAQKTFNKENMQVKSLLLAECFPKHDSQQKNNHGRYGQMLRANKNSALFSMAGNARQRKFHNLQQPSVTMPKKNQKF